MGIALVYRGRSTFDRTGVAVNTASAVAIGAADYTRVVAVFVVINAPDTSTTTSAITVGGVSATRYAFHQPFAQNRGEIWVASVPTGTTADIVLTLSNTAAIIAELEVYSLTGGSAISPLSVHSPASPANGTYTLDIPAGGAALYCSSIATDTGGQTPAWGWTGATKDVEADAGNWETHSTASLTTATTLTAYAVDFANSGSPFSYSNIGVAFESGGDPATHLIGLDAIAGIPSASIPAIGQVHGLFAGDVIAGTATATVPIIGQVHHLNAADSVSSPAVASSPSAAPPLSSSTAIFTAPSRQTVFTAGIRLKVMTMQAQQLSPIDVGEIETVTVDFSSQFTAGVTITAIVSVTCTVHYGVSLDAAPHSRLVGSPQITTSPVNGAASAAVVQQVGTMVGGVTYLIQAIVTTSDNQTISVWGYLPCVQPI